MRLGNESHPASTSAEDLPTLCLASEVETPQRASRKAMRSLSRFRLFDDSRRVAPMGTKQGLASVAIFKGVELVLRSLSDYHDYRAYGIEHVPREGAALLIFNHSLATYDALLLDGPLYDEVGRLPCGIVDRLVLRTPVLGRTARELGFIEGSRRAAVEILSQGHILGLTPGGMREALRSSRDKYRVDWQGRTGFVWASCLSGAPIILAACPRSDDIFSVADSPLTRHAYQTYKVPFPLFRGVGPSPLPRRVKLRHLLSEPILPPVPPDRVTERDVIAHHEALTARMNNLLHEALSLD